MNLFTVEFRIEGTTLIPSNITEIFALDPSLTSDMLTQRARTTPRIPFWAYDGISTENNFVEQKWESLEEGLSFLLEKLVPKYDLIQTALPEYKVYWWCGYFQDTFDGGIILSPSILKKLSDFNIELIIKTYQ